MKQVNVRLKEELIKEIKRIALENDTTVQFVITLALERFTSDKGGKL